jgi:hypothetical protein
VLDPWRIVFEEYFEPNVVLPLCAGYLKEWCFTYLTRLWFFLTLLCDPFCGLQKGKYFGGQRRKAIDSLVWSLPRGVVTLKPWKTVVCDVARSFPICASCCVRL